MKASLLAGGCAGLVAFSLLGLGVPASASQDVGRAGAEPSWTVSAAPKMPSGSRVIGHAQADGAVKFDLFLRPRDPSLLKAIAGDISRPGSTSFRHYLSVSQFAARFGQPATVLNHVAAELKDLGLKVGQPAANGLMIPVSTTVGRAATSLKTSFASVRLASGRLALTNTASVKLPASVAAVTQGVVGLNDLPMPVRRSPSRRTARTAVPTVGTLGTSAITACQSASNAAGSSGGWTYPQLASAYSLNSLYANGNEGSGINIALFELDPWLGSDIKAFQKCYGTSTGVSTVKVDGGAGTGAGQQEAALDIETAIGLAPKSHITVYDAPAASYAQSTLDEYTKIFDDNKSQIVSASYGLCESYIESTSPGLLDSENTLFEQAATEGISVLAASGDTGSEGCIRAADGADTSLGVLDPASQPFVTAIGGTDLASVGNPPTESTWNDGPGSGGSGGGGLSNYWPMPSWQSGPGVDNPNSDGQREVPDVSASADPKNPYVIYYAGHWVAIGGTSAATPLWAGMLADILSGSGSSTRAGFLNPTLYSAAASGAVQAFNDITIGNNDFTGQQGGLYPATAAYDLTTGIGSPIASALAGYVYADTNSLIAFTDAPGTNAPPSRLGPSKVKAFKTSFCKDGSYYTSISGPTGKLGLSPSVECVSVGTDWATWSNGYAGNVLWDDENSGDVNTLTITLPAGTKAFYFYAEPDEFETFDLEATAQDGTSSGPLQVYGNSGAEYFGFYTQGSSSIQTITVSCDDDFAVGEMGIAKK